MLPLTELADTAVARASSPREKNNGVRWLMTALCMPALCMTTAWGCSHEVSQSVKVARPVSRRAEANSSAAELARATLAQRLAVVEAKLDRALAAGGTEPGAKPSKEAVDERRALARQRLVLTIAYVEIGRRIASGDTGALDVDRLLTSVELMLAQREKPKKKRKKRRWSGARAAGDKRPIAPPRERGPSAGKKDRDRDKAPVGGARKDETKKPKPSASKAPLDLLDEDSRGGEEEETGGVQKARVETESRPRGLMTAVHQRVGAIESCLGAIDDDLTLRVTLRLDAGGSVRGTKVRGVEGRVGACISRVLNRVRVPDHVGGTRVVRFPLYFQPD